MNDNPKAPTRFQKGMISYMLGAIIRDIIGSCFEWHNHRDKHFERFTEACRMTDDSIMTLVVAKALMETKKTCQMQHSIFQKNKEETIMKMQFWSKQKPDNGQRV